MSAEEQKKFPHKNVITRALGMRDTVQVDVSAEDIKDGDVFLLCSDGLTGMVDEKRIGGHHPRQAAIWKARSPAWSRPPTRRAAATTSRCSPSSVKLN